MTYIARIILLVFVGLVSWIAFQPELNLAAWTPNLLMRRIGFSYQSILTYEHHFHLALHFMVGAIIAFLLYHGKFYANNNAKLRIIFGLIMVFIGSVFVEWGQSIVGRNVEVADLLFGFAGALIVSVGLLCSILREQS